MKEIIEVGRPAGSPSKVVVGGGLLASLDDYVPAGRRTIVITDSNVHRRYRNEVERREHIVIGLGETHKTLPTVERIYRELIAMNADRETFIVGFGGGIVTDIAGFTASTYMRGLDFGFVASTLLAQVDASVGGKNGVNVDGYKNMVGCFSQPEFVLCDTALLATLPVREVHAGAAEMIKAGVVADPALFALFEEHTLDDIVGDNALLTAAVTAAVRVKARIVSGDERERGERRKLNLGHTFAHAIEKSSTAHLHGEAVAAGLCMIAEIAVRLGALAEGDCRRICRAVASAGLPTATDIDRKRLLKAIALDKKRDTDSIHIVLPTGIGSCEVRKMTFGQLEELI